MDIRDLFVISDVPNHQELKQQILDGIKKMGTHSSIVEGSDICNTDWELRANFPRPYFQLVQPLFEEQHKKLCALYPIKTTAMLMNFWFQQYALEGFHGWHLHDSCTYSNVYYVELPEGSSKTTFKFLDQEFEMDVKEGQILSAPSLLLHCSKPNKSQQIKTIIAFNTSIRSH